MPIVQSQYDTVAIFFFPVPSSFTTRKRATCFLPFVIGYPRSVLVHRRINQRPYADACLDARQLAVAPQAASQPPFLLQKSNAVSFYQSSQQKTRKNTSIAKVFPVALTNANRSKSSHLFVLSKVTKFSNILLLK